RKIVDIPAFDACRAWRSWEADNPQIEKLEEAEKAFGLQRKLMQALIKSRLYGGAAMGMGIENQRSDEGLGVYAGRPGYPKFIHVVSRWGLASGPLIRDITSPWFGEPTYHQRSNVVTPPQVQLKDPLEESSLGYQPGEMLFIHPSRVVRFIGHEY